MKKDFSNIKLFAMDVDGTLTDGKIYIGNDGEVMKAFNAKDGLGIKLLIKKGIVPIIITGRRSKIVTRRCEEIGITVLYQGVRDKADILKNVMAKYDCTPPKQCSPIFLYKITGGDTKKATKLRPHWPKIH